MELAGVVKVLVPLAIMDAAQQAQRYVGALGGHLFTVGATEISLTTGPAGGLALPSRSLALIVASAAFGDLLNPQPRALARSGSWD